MPRAFLITNKRYNSLVEFEDILSADRDPSPERSVSTAEGPTDSRDFESLTPSRPKSPAHESNSAASSTVHESKCPTSKTAHESKCPTSSTAHESNSAASSTVHESTVQGVQQRCVISCYTNASIVTVIHQLMKQSASPDPAQEQQKPLETHICPECGKRYSTSSNLARHRQIHRSVTDKKARKCPHCEKVYVSIPAYSMHVRTHTQGCRCPCCGKCFSRPWLLQGHIRTHTGEKPFICNLCQKAFADKSNLRAHVQTHSDSKPYSCERCGKAFALKSYLYKHEESSCMKIHKDKAIAQEVEVQ